MSLKTRLFGAVSPFAHLNGPVIKPAADTQVPGQTQASVEENPVVDPARASTTSLKAEKKGKKAKNADEDDDDDDGEDEDGDQDSDEEEMRAEEEDAEDDDMKKSKKAFHNAIRAARLRERARCAAIFGAAAAGGNPALAAQIAFMSNNGRDSAIGILKAAGASVPKTGLAARMSGVAQPTISAGGGDGDQQMRPADRALAAAAKARGKAA